MIRHLEAQRTKDNVRLSYVIRPPECPTEFESLLHELEYYLPIDGSTAANKCDQKQLYGILDNNTSDNQYVRGLSITMAKARIVEVGSVYKICVKATTTTRCDIVS